MGRIVIVCYRPKAGKDDALAALVANHVPTLRRLGLATDREAVTMRSSSGAFVEVFEWTSPDAIRQAHQMPEVMKMWEAFGEACDFVPLTEVPEAAQVFSEFAPV